MVIDTGGILKTYNVVLIKREAVPPGDSSKVGCYKFDDIQFEGLLHKHDVVLGHAEAVEVAREQSGPNRDRTELLYLPQSQLFGFFTWNRPFIIGLLTRLFNAHTLFAPVRQIWLLLLTI